MIRLSDKSVVGTSFHDVTIKTCVSDLKNILGEPQFSENKGDDKTNFEWNCEIAIEIDYEDEDFDVDENTEVFTIYDWKEYRRISEYEQIEFHIGGKNYYITMKAKEELEELLKKNNSNILAY